MMAPLGSALNLGHCPKPNFAEEETEAQASCVALKGHLTLGRGGNGGPGRPSWKWRQYLKEHAGQVVLRAEHPHLSSGPDPALARRLLWAAFGLWRLCTVCRKGSMGSW